jgi:hypothetical protein
MKKVKDKFFIGGAENKSRRKVTTAAMISHA